MGRLDGKVAIVTGGNSGFGRAIINKFLAEGSKVVLFDLAYGEPFEPKENVAFFQGSVVDADNWQGALDLTIKQFGKLDIVVNNAGVIYNAKPTVDLTEAEFDRTFDINVKSLFFSWKKVIPYFEKIGKGCFVQICSVGSIRPEPEVTWYNGTKGAVNLATKSMAVEYGPKQIRFNSVSPAASVMTGMKSQFLYGDEEALLKRYTASIPLGRLAQPEDVANAVAFFASDEAAFINGANLEVDGGRCV